MKNIVLSDHASQQIAAAQQARQSEHARAQAASEERQAPAKARSDWLGAHARQALESYRYVTWLFLNVVRYLHDFTWGMLSWRMPELAPAGHSEAIWSAGSQGEQLVKAKLAGVLGDEFTLVSGYKNQKGEIDQILVGPNGVICIEIKYLNGHISCVGDVWSRDRYDQCGNLVESNLPIRDKGGRGPSAQLNESANRLEEFLRQRMGIERVCRAVVFAHEGSVLRSIRAPTVDVVSDLKTFGVWRLIDEMPRNACRVSVEEVVGLICRDHEFHTRKSAQYRASKAARTPGN